MTDEGIIEKGDNMSEKNKKRLYSLLEMLAVIVINNRDFGSGHSSEN